MIEPGTPAIDLPAFAAPTFTAASVPIGGVVTKFSLESTSPVAQANVPFKFAQPFNVGELVPGDGLVAVRGSVMLPLQVDFKATHDDGSLRHAIISGIWPALDAGEQHDIQMVRALPHESAPVEVPVLPVRAIITIAGVEYIAEPSDEGTAWMSGHVAVERIHDVPFICNGAPHPDLTAQFCLRQFDGGSATIDVTLEKTMAYRDTGDITYDVQIIIDGTVRYLSAVTHFPFARWKKTFWIGQDNPVHVKHNVGYLIGTKAVPNYDTRVVMEEKTLNQWAALLKTAAFAPMGNGRFQKSMGTGGGRPDIAIAPDSYAATIISMDKRAKDMMLASADMAGSWSAHRRDRSNGPAAGQPMDIIHWPRSTLLGNYADTKNKLTGQYEDLPEPASTSDFKADTSHQAGFAYFPYLLTGDYYYLEELIFWNNYNTYQSNPGYRKSEKGLINNLQPRAQAWCIRTFSETAYILPDNHPGKAAARFWFENNMAFYNANYPTTNVLGLFSLGSYSGNYTVLGVKKTGHAPWMDDFVTQALGHAAELGFESAKQLMQWKARYPIGRMTAPGFCWIDASAYALRHRDGLDMPCFTTFAEIYEKSFTPEHRANACNSAARLAYRNSVNEYPLDMNEMVGYSWLTHGYPSNLQGALAMAVDTGLPGGKEAWTLFDNRAKQPKYGTSPQFAIVPRTFVAPKAEAPVPVPVDPAPVEPTPVPPIDPAPLPVDPAPIPDPVPVEPAPIPPVEPPIVIEPVPSPVEPGPAPVPPTPELPEPPAPALATLTFNNPALAGQTGLTLLIGDLTAMAVFALPADADREGTVTVASARIQPNKRYGAVATSADGKILAVLFPVIGG